jgi:drug/metabolite transporter (DMT)-like permease
MLLRYRMPSADIVRMTNHRLAEHLHASSESQSSDDRRNAQKMGTLVLLTVPFAWGSFEPATRYIYAMDPPVPGFLFSLAYYIVAAITLLIASVVSDGQNEATDEQSENGSNNRSGDQAPLWPTAGGVELGLYLFVGNALQVIGLKTVPSDRAAFLLQLTTIFVPLLQALFVRDWSVISRRTWLACVIALFGVAVMGLDGGDSAMTIPTVPSMEISSLLSAWRFSSDDFLVAAAAVAYSFHCIRLEGYAQTCSAVKLAASKATTETLCSALTLAAVVGYSSNQDAGTTPSDGTSLLSSFAQDSAEEITCFASYLVNGIADGTVSIVTLWPVAGAIVWTGWVTVAYTIYAQSYGQRRVRPATANLIYTIQPVCTAMFAWVLLGETLGAAGFVGGALVGAAVLLVAIPVEDL